MWTVYCRRKVYRRRRVYRRSECVLSRAAASDMQRLFAKSMVVASSNYKGGLDAATIAQYIHYFYYVASLSLCEVRTEHTGPCALFVSRVTRVATRVDMDSDANHAYQVETL